MQLNPRLARLMETYEPERLQALLLWFNTDQQSLNTQSERLSSILAEAQSRDIADCYRLASQLQPAQLAEFSILNEFGPNFAARASFPWLVRGVSQRLAR